MSKNKSKKTEGEKKPRSSFFQQSWEYFNGKIHKDKKKEKKRKKKEKHKKDLKREPME